MAIQIPVITEFIDQGLKDAKSAFGNFKASVAGAEGAMGKFRAGATSALDIVKANAGTFALGAGAAMTAFAAKSVTAFQDLALEAGKFADATGLAVDDASRWIEVAGDIGVEAGTVETAMGKMNKTLGASPELFKKLGVEVARTSGGAVDANKTFLNVIDRLNEIKDPAERAKVASQLLGKGWQSMAELIAQGSDTLAQSLDKVADARVIKPQDLNNARQFRASMDDLKDAASNLSLELGRTLVPVLLTIIDSMKTIGDFFGSIIDTADMALTDLGLTHKGWIEEVVKEGTALDAANKVRRDGNQALIDAYNATHNLTYAEEQHTEAVWALTDAWKTLLGTLDVNRAFRNAKADLDAMNKAAIEAFGDPTKFDDYKNQQDQVIQNFAKILEQLQATDEEQNRIKFLVDTAPLEYALEALNRINLARTGQIQTTPLTLTGKRAAGGPVMAGGSYLVGENGPEIFTPGSSGSITPNGAIGGANITVNVSGADPNAVVRALQQYVRQSGPVPVNTRAM